MRVAGLVMVCLLVLASCGDSDGAGSRESGPTSEDLPSELEEALAEAERLARFVTDTLGAEEGLQASLIAWERGYSNEQILALGTDGVGLAHDGRITRDDEIVEPKEPPRGVIAIPEEFDAAIGDSGSSTIEVELASFTRRSGVGALPAEDDAGLEESDELFDLAKAVQKLDICSQKLTLDRFDLDYLGATTGLSGYPKEDPESARAGGEVFFTALNLLIDADGLAAMVLGAALGLCPELKAAVVYEYDEDDRYDTSRNCYYLVVDGDPYPSQLNWEGCDSAVAARERDLAGNGGDETTEATEEPAGRAFTGPGKFSIVLDGNEFDDGCNRSLDVDVQVLLQPNKTATLRLSDRPIATGTPTTCLGTGKEVIYSGTWDYLSDSGVDDPGVIDAEIGFGLLENAVFTVKIRRRQGNVTAETNTTRSDGALHYTIEFKVPEVT